MWGVRENEELQNIDSGSCRSLVGKQRKCSLSLINWHWEKERVWGWGCLLVMEVSEKMKKIWWNQWWVQLENLVARTHLPWGLRKTHVNFRASYQGFLLTVSEVGWPWSLGGVRVLFLRTHTCVRLCGKAERRVLVSWHSVSTGCPGLAKGARCHRKGP